MPFLAVSPLHPLPAFSQVWNTGSHQDKKGEKQQDHPIAASWGNSLRAGRNSKLKWTGWSKGNCLASWPVNKSFLFFTLSRWGCSQSSAWFWASAGARPLLWPLWCGQRSVSSSSHAAKASQENVVLPLIWSFEKPSLSHWAADSFSTVADSFSAVRQLCSSLSTLQPYLRGLSGYWSIHKAVSGFVEVMAWSVKREKRKSDSALPETIDGAGAKLGQVTYLLAVSCTPPNPYHAE